MTFSELDNFSVTIPFFLFCFKVYFTNIFFFCFNTFEDSDCSSSLWVQKRLLFPSCNSNTINCLDSDCISKRDWTDFQKSKGITIIEADRRWTGISLVLQRGPCEGDDRRDELIWQDVEDMMAKDCCCGGLKFQETERDNGLLVQL